MTHCTRGHWGIYEVEANASGAPGKMIELLIRAGVGRGKGA
jgi:hypothetical protein